MYLSCFIWINSSNILWICRLDRLTWNCVTTLGWKETRTVTIKDSRHSLPLFSLFFILLCSAVSVPPTPLSSISAHRPTPSRPIPTLNANLQLPQQSKAVGLKIFSGLFSKCDAPLGRGICYQDEISRSGFIQQRAKPPAGCPGCQETLPCFPLLLPFKAKSQNNPR